MPFSIFETDISLPEPVKQAALEFLPSFVSAEDDASLQECALRIADAFGDSSGFSPLLGEKTPERDGAESRMTESFRRNIGLLVQKTWVEKSDEAMKEEVLARIDALCRNLEAGKYRQALQDSLPVLKDVVYLLFGSVAKEEGFLEYAVRVDPDFGFFWFYITSLGNADAWSGEKCRTAVFLGLYFLANF